MTPIEELEKAINGTAAEALETLKKSQIAFDFDPGPNPHDHHVAYNRQSKSGKVSQIQAKGVQTDEAIRLISAKGGQHVRISPMGIHYTDHKGEDITLKHSARGDGKKYVDTKELDKHLNKIETPPKQQAKISSPEKADTEKKEAYKRLSERADELTQKADGSNTSLDHDTARVVHIQAAGIYEKGSAKRKYHLDMAKYHSTRP